MRLFGKKNALANANVKFKEKIDVKQLTNTLEHEVEVMRQENVDQKHARDAKLAKE